MSSYGQDHEVRRQNRVAAVLHVADARAVVLAGAQRKPGRVAVALQDQIDAIGGAGRAAQSRSEKRCGVAVRVFVQSERAGLAIGRGDLETRLDGSDLRLASGVEPETSAIDRTDQPAGRRAVDDEEERGRALIVGATHGLGSRQRRRIVNHDVSVLL